MNNKIKKSNTQEFVDSVIPHGGKLINLLVEPEKAEVLKNISIAFPNITLTSRHLSDLTLLMNGAFSPLSGFMKQPDYESVVDGMHLQDNTLWPIPICLDIPSSLAKGLEVGQSVALLDGEGFMPAVMHIEDIWPVDKQYEANKVYGTTDTSHPGVDYLFNQMGTHYIGGKVEGIQTPLHYAFRRHRHSPSEVRALYKKLGWRRVVGFQTRNPLHRVQLEITLRAMEKAKANLLLHPVVRRVKSDDIDIYTRIRCYLEAEKHYPPNMMLLSLLPLAMRMAGPREAILHAIIRKNYGCTHFIIGKDHAGTGICSNKKNYYKPYEAQELALSVEDELGISIIPFEEMVYVVEEDEYMPISEVSKGNRISKISDEEFHRKLKTAKTVPQWFSFPEVIEELRMTHPPRYNQGFTVFCTGLSGAGKSTVARLLHARFLEMGDRPVTLLDGDIVRQNLSKELGFSKEHRDINVRRIGFVASEITKNKGIAICAPIAPYMATRNHIRQNIEKYGGFIEVHVSTPIDICENRDRKGLYAKARSGLIKGFTGIDDPYESPKNPEVFIDTSNITPDEAAQEVLLYLGRAGYIK